MNIWIDTYSVEDAHMMNRAYDAVLHYELNEHDDLDLEVLRKMKTEVETIIRRRLNEAIKCKEV